MDYFVDFLGSVTARADSSANIVTTNRYKPYGTVLSGNALVSGQYAWTGNTGSRHSGVAYAEQYNRDRHYSSITSQWTTRDPLWPEEATYGYVNGNPVRWTDPSGRACFSGIPTETPFTKLNDKFGGLIGACITLGCAAKSVKELKDALKEIGKIIKGTGSTLTQKDIDKFINHLNNLRDSRPISNTEDCCNRAGAMSNYSLAALGSPNDDFFKQWNIFWLISKACHSGIGPPVAWAKCAKLYGEKTDECEACCKNAYDPYETSIQYQKCLQGCNGKITL